MILYLELNSLFLVFYVEMIQNLLIFFVIGGYILVELFVFCIIGMS